MLLEVGLDEYCHGGCPSGGVNCGVFCPLAALGSPTVARLSTVDCVDHFSGKFPIRIS